MCTALRQRTLLNRCRIATGRVALCAASLSSPVLEERLRSVVTRCVTSCCFKAPLASSAPDTQYVCVVTARACCDQVDVSLLVILCQYHRCSLTDVKHPEKKNTATDPTNQHWSYLLLLVIPGNQWYSIIFFGQYWAPRLSRSFQEKFWPTQREPMATSRLCFGDEAVGQFTPKR